MNGKASVSGVQAPGNDKTKSPRLLTQLDPSNVRVVALVITATGQILRHDCYDPEGSGAEIGDVMRIQKDQLWLRTVEWARSRSMDAEIRLQWTPMGIAPEEIGRISVFTWPEKDPLRVFVDPS